MDHGTLSVAGVSPRSSLAVRRVTPLIKYLVHQSMDLSLRESLDLSHVAQEHARTTEDHKEAVQAFLEKRRPVFRGR